MDMDIIKCLKHPHKTALHLRRYTAITCNNIHETDIILLDAPFLLKTVWQQKIWVSTTKNCFGEGIITKVIPDVEGILCDEKIEEV